MLECGRRVIETAQGNPPGQPLGAMVEGAMEPAVIGDNIVSPGRLAPGHQLTGNAKTLKRPPVRLADVARQVVKEFQCGLMAPPPEAPVDTLEEELFVIAQARRNVGDCGVDTPLTVPQAYARLCETGESVVLHAREYAPGRGGLATPDQPVDTRPVLLGRKPGPIGPEKGPFSRSSERVAAPGVEDGCTGLCFLTGLEERFDLAQDARVRQGRPA